MKVLLLLVFFSLTELVYFRIANYFNIIDKPNERSLHTKVTIRGGGILFVIAVILFFIYSNFSYPYFFLGMLCVAIISFLDDIYTLSSRYRLPFQFLAILMIILELDIYNNFSLVFIIIYLIIGVGIINAYNFMDGINGITGGYSTVILVALWVVNNYYKSFVENDLLIFVLASVIVFNFFNFRKKALCFAGDVGSISIAVIILFLITKISIIDNNPIFFLFLSVYGVDSIITIIYRLKKKENIFQAHRTHLFQIIVFRKNVPHLLMSGGYALLQTLICLLVICQLHSPSIVQYLSGILIVTILILSYIFTRYKILNEASIAE